MNRKELLEKAADIIKNDPLVKKYMNIDTWVSGSSTTVYPVTCWVESGAVDVQLNTHRNVFDKRIQKIVRESNGLINKGYFVKNDGSCPSELRFYINF